MTGRIVYIPPRECWGALREQLLNLLDDLVGDRLRVEGREDHQDQFGESPDLAGALTQSWAYPNA